jgi:hypothetical protein
VRRFGHEEQFEEGPAIFADLGGVVRLQRLRAAAAISRAAN